MTFARIAKMKLFDELLERRQKEQKCPSLGWIVKFSKLTDADQAESMLRDMERDGVLTVYRMGPYPWVALKRLTYGGKIVSEMSLDAERFDQFTDGTDVLVIKDAPDPRTLPSKGRARDDEFDTDIEETVSAIEHQTARLLDDSPDRNSAAKLPVRAARDLTLESPKADAAGLAGGETPQIHREVPQLGLPSAEAPGTLIEVIHAFLRRTGMSPSRFGREAANRVHLVKHVRAGMTPRFQTEQAIRDYIIGHTAGSSGTSRKTVGVSPSKTATITAGVSPEQSAQVTMIPMAVPETGMPQPPEKPRVRAEIVRAWQNDGRPFDQFLTALLDLGLESYNAFREAA